MPDVSSCHANRDADLAVGEATLEERAHGSRADILADLSLGRLVAVPQTSFRNPDQLTQGREGGAGKECKKSLERSHDAPDLSHFTKQGKQAPEPSHRGAGTRVRDYCTLNRKKAALSSGVNSKQMLPSTTDNDSGVTVRGAKVLRSADSKKWIFICTFPALFSPMVFPVRPSGSGREALLDPHPLDGRACQWPSTEERNGTINAVLREGVRHGDLADHAILCPERHDPGHRILG